jgi:hypothetical protein
MHFPLHKNTEVLLTFIEGDPDRPIIAAALPNPVSPSPVNSANQSKSVIQTGRGPETSSVGARYVRTRGGERPTGNYIEFDDTQDQELIRIEVDADRDTTVTSAPIPASPPPLTDSQMLEVGPPDFASTYAGLKDPGYYNIKVDPPGLYTDYGNKPNWRPYLTGSNLTADEIKDWLKGNVLTGKTGFNIPTRDASDRYYPYWESKFSKRQQYEMANPGQEPWQYSPVVRREEIIHGSYNEHIQGDMLTKVEGTWDCTIKGHLYNTTWGHVHSDYYQTHSESYYGDVLDVYGQSTPDEIKKTDGSGLYTGDVTVTEIVYGPKYEWHFGDKMEVVYGKVYESHTGEKYEYIMGTLYEEQRGGKESIIDASAPGLRVYEEITGPVINKITGDVENSITGDVKDTIEGDVVNVFGISGVHHSFQEIYRGHKSSVHVGTHNEFNVAENFVFNFANNMEMNFLTVINLILALQIDLGYAVKINLDFGPTIVRDGSVSIDDGMLKIGSKKFTLNQDTFKFESGMAIHD